MGHEAQGSLLSSVSLAATLATILERHFGEAAAWCLLNAVLSALGFACAGVGKPFLLKVASAIVFCRPPDLRSGALTDPQTPRGPGPKAMGRPPAGGLQGTFGKG